MKREDFPMKPKYQMTREQSIFVAKRNIIDYIWKSARLEGLAVTYPDTEAIYNGMGVSGVKVSEIIAVNNLKHAWSFILDNLDYPTDYPLICKINQFVGGNNLIINAGFLRTMPVSIGGTTWNPDMPIESQIKEELAEISKIEDATDYGITMMLYLVRQQMFLDGNKRTSMLAANHSMIANGVGVISVPIELHPEFTKMLVDYYESGDMTVLKQFVYERCIDGIDFEPVRFVDHNEGADCEFEGDELELY